MSSARAPAGREGDTRVEGARALDSEVDPLLGQVVDGRFRVVAPIARGGMGRVYRAVQEPLGRDVAFKVLDVRNAAAKRSDFHRRFFLEAAIASRLNHPNTVVVLDHGQWGDDLYFIAMELVEGRTLLDAIREDGPLDPVRAVHVATQICGSLADAHARGVVHRDLKPGNVMLTRRGNDPSFVKVVDFGLVKVLTPDEELDLTQSGVMVGSPRYMAPEQVLGRQVGTTADVYSLGAVLFHMVTGKPPFDGESKFEVLQAQVHQAPPSVRETYPWCAVSRELEAIIMRCLAKKPDERFATMDELAGALAVVNPTRGDTAAIAMPPRPAPPPVDALAPSQRSGESTPFLSPPPRELVAHQARSSSNVLLVGAAVAALVIAGGAVWSLIRPRGHQDELDSTLGTDPPGSSAAGGAHATTPVGATPTGAHAPLPTPPTVAAVPTPLGAGGSTEAIAPVRLVTDPLGARVSRDGIDLGDAPVTLLVPPGEQWTIQVWAAGYENRSVVVSAGQGELRVGLARAAAPAPRRDRRPESNRTTDNRDPWAHP